MAAQQRYTWVLNCIESREQEKDWNDDSIISPDAARAAKTVKLPAAVDLRKNADWWTIGNQKDTGSCVGWATGDGVIRYQMVKAGMLTSDKMLSVRYLWMAAKETDEYLSRPTSFIESAGTFIKAACMIAQKYGVIEDDVLQLFGGKLCHYEVGQLYAIAARRRISSFVNLGVPGDKWKKWLAQDRPIATRLCCDDVWMSGGKKGRLETYDEASASEGHAVTVAGYDDYGWIIRNSWGKQWGDSGYAYASYDYAAKAFTESYGVVV